MHATTDETNQYNLPTLQQNKTLIIYQSHNNNNKFRYLYTYRFIFNYIYESFFCVQQKEIRTNASHIMVRKNSSSSICCTIRTLFNIFGYNT